MRKPGPEEGFTLLEALVALAVLAVAAAGLIGAAEARIDGVRALEDRAAARWVAENRLAELGLAGKDRGGSEGRVEMLGREWQVAVSERASADPDLRRLEVAVGRPGEPPLVRLAGFRDMGTITR